MNTNDYPIDNRKMVVFDDLVNYNEKIKGLIATISPMGVTMLSALYI